MWLKGTIKLGNFSIKNAINPCPLDTNGQEDNSEPEPVNTTNLTSEYTAELLTKDTSKIVKQNIDKQWSSIPKAIKQLEQVKLKCKLAPWVNLPSRFIQIQE